MDPAAGQRGQGGASRQLIRMITIHAARHARCCPASRRNRLVPRLHLFACIACVLPVARGSPSSAATPSGERLCQHQWLHPRPTHAPTALPLVGPAAAAAAPVAATSQQRGRPASHQQPVNLCLLRAGAAGAAPRASASGAAVVERPPPPIRAGWARLLHTGSIESMRGLVQALEGGPRCQQDHQEHELAPTHSRQALAPGPGTPARRRLHAACCPWQGLPCCLPGQGRLTPAPAPCAGTSCCPLPARLAAEPVPAPAAMPRQHRLARQWLV